MGNPKELEDIQNKIAERKRRHAHLEDDLLETMIQVEELQAVAQPRLKDGCATSKPPGAHATKNAERRIAAVETRTQRPSKPNVRQLADQVTAENLDVYETLRAQKRGQAVAVLEDDSCSVCRVGQTENIVKQVRQDQQLVKCTSCGRILVVLW